MANLMMTFDDDSMDGEDASKDMIGGRPKLNSICNLNVENLIGYKTVYHFFLLVR